MARITVILAFGQHPSTEDSDMAVVATEDSAMAVVSTALDMAQDTTQVLEDMVYFTTLDTDMDLQTIHLEELLLVSVQAVPRVHWLLARRVAVVPLEPLDPVPVPLPVPLPAGSDVRTSLWLATRL